LAEGASAGRSDLQRAHDAIREAENGRMNALAESARLRAELERAHLDAAHVPLPAGEADERVAALSTQVDQLRAKLAEAEAGAAHEQRAREELEGRLAGGVNAGQHEVRKALSAARDAERARAAAVAEVERLRTELELARFEAQAGPSEPGRRDERIGPLLAEIGRLRARLAEAEAGAAHEHRARDELETRLTQSATAGQQELRRALEAARHAEEARATTVAEVAHLRSELERARSEAARAPGTREEIDARIVELGTEIDRLRTRLAEAEAGAAHQHRAREALEARLSGGASSDQQELQKALARARDAEQARIAAAAEVARLGAELERARLTAAGTPEHADHLAARWSELTGEIDRLHARLAEAEAGAAHEHRAREALEARLTETASGSTRDLQAVRDAVRGAEETRDAALADVARLTAELKEVRAEAARLPELRNEADTRARELAAQVDQLAARLTAAEAGAARSAGRGRRSKRGSPRACCRSGANARTRLRRRARAPPRRCAASLDVSRKSWRPHGRPPRAQKRSAPRSTMPRTSGSAPRLRSRP
jgi:chromosome segregation ATPase